MKNNSLNNVKYLLTTHVLEKMPIDELFEFVIVGKSNVGKSTFINTITNRKNIALTSSKPGKTKAISFFDVGNGSYRLVDIPGYGYANVSKIQKQIFATMIDQYLSQRKNIYKAILLLDIRRGITEIDREMINYFVYYKIPFTVIGTKDDKVTQSERFKFLQNMKSELSTIPILYSSVNKKGLDKIINIFNIDED